MEEDMPEEIEAMNKMWLMDKVASMERERQEKKRGSKKWRPDARSKKTC